MPSLSARPPFLAHLALLVLAKPLESRHLGLGLCWVEGVCGGCVGWVEPARSGTFFALLPPPEIGMGDLAFDHSAHVL